MKIEVSGAREFAADLGRVAFTATLAVRPVVEKALLNVKKDARQRVSSHPSWRQLPSTISYEMTGPLSGEVGYEDRGQGNLAVIAEFGSSRHAPHPALVPAVEAEGKRFEEALDVVLGRLL